MQKLLVCAIGLLVINSLLWPSAIVAQTNVLPRPFEVYGGMIGTIEAIPVPNETNKTRVFASTDSANSVFYADVDHASPTPFDTNFIFRVMPDMDANANFGAPNWIAAHLQSGRLFVGTSSGLLSCTVSSGSLITNIAAAVSFVLIQDSHLFAVGQAVDEFVPRTLYYGTLDNSGNPTFGSPLATNFYGRSVTLAINPVSRKVYVLCTLATNSVLFKSSADYDAFDSATTFSEIPTAAVTMGVVNQVTIGPDGKRFLGGGSSTLKVALADDDSGSWTNIDTGGLLAGSSRGLNIVCNGSSNAYEVYYGTVVSTNQGAAGTWIGLPRPGGHRPPSMHVDAGSTKVDPNNAQTIYVSTDKGIGGSTNAGVDVVELNNGLLAFQINDIAALSDKTVAWIGSKAGVRIATNFNTTPIWTDGDFPDAIVYAVAIDSDDPSGMTGYAGSSRLYKTTTGGGTNASAWTQVFRWEDYGLADGEIAAVRANAGRVVLGYYSYAPNSPSGGVFFSSNSGSNWTAVMTNIDVQDLLVRDEEGTSILYIAASKAKAGDRGGIYRLDPSSPSVTLDLTNDVNIRKLAEDSTGGLYASGTLPDTAEPGRYRVAAYYRASNTSGWEQLTANGLPTGLWDGEVIGRVGGPPVITIGKDNASNDVPVLAAVRTIYYLPYGGTSWVTVTNYPNGTQIKTLFWDELMVGTTIGLYGQGINAQPQLGSNIVTAADYDGDRKADPAVYTTNNQWVIWMSSLGYTLQGPYPFGLPGATPLTGDFDGDGKADPAVYTTNSQWVVWMSRAGYAPAGPFVFSFPGATPAPADFDGDGVADPAVYLDGYWLIWMSGGGYAPQGPFTFGYAGTTPVPADYDGDQRADPAVFADGYWLIWMSSGGYQPLGPLQFGIPNTLPVPGDFDGDGKADPAVVLSGSWYIWMSASGYQMTGPFIFTVE